MFRIGKLLFLILLLCASVAHGARFARDIKWFEINDVSGGLMTSIAAHKIPKNFSPGLLNVYIDERFGTIVKGRGFDVLGSTPTLQNGKVIHVYIRPDGGKEFIVTDSSVVATTQDFNTYTILRRGLNTDYEPRFKTIRGKVWSTNGSDAVWTYDGSTVTVLDGQNYSGNLTPNVPRGKYIEYEQERVWIGNLSTDDSETRYSATSDTNGVIIAPDATLAWPGDYSLPVGEGDGTQITWMKSFRGFLRIGKDRSIHTVFGTNRATYKAVKTIADVGFASDMSVVEQDNLLYGHARDGVYAFDGNSVQRITDRIKDNISSLRVDTQRTINNTWDTESDFLAGATMRGTTVTADGFVTTYTEYQQLNIASAAYPSDTAGFVRINPSVTPYGPYSALASTFTIPDNFVGDIPSLKFYMRCVSCNTGARLSIRNTTTGKQFTAYTPNVPNTVFALEPFTNICSTNGATWNRSDLVGGNFQVQFVAAGIGGSGCPDNAGEASSNISFDFFPASGTGFANILLRPSTTGQYISQITTVTSLTSWGTFNSVRNTNGGSIDFFVKTATSLVQIATAPFISIAPGAVIASTPTNTFIQWASTVASISTTSAANIDSVEIGHTEGSASNTRSFAVGWLGRYWLFGSTETTGNFPALYIKAKNTNSVPDAWMYFNGIPMRSVIESDGILYGGGATSGAFYRLDYGTSYNGTAISAYYETPDLILDNDFEDKTLLEYWIDIDRESGATLDVGTKINGGTLRTSTYSIDGSGRALKNIYNVDKSGRYFRIRIGNSQLDVGMNFHALSIGYMKVPLQ